MADVFYDLILRKYEFQFLHQENFEKKYCQDKLVHNKCGFLRKINRQILPLNILHLSSTFVESAGEDQCSV